MTFTRGPGMPSEGRGQYSAIIVRVRCKNELTEETCSLSAHNETRGCYECVFWACGRTLSSEPVPASSTGHYVSCWTPEDKHCRENGQQTIPLDPLFIPINTKNNPQKSLWAINFIVGLRQASADNDHHFVWRWSKVKHAFAGLKSFSRTCENCWNKAVFLVFI